MQSEETGMTKRTVPPMSEIRVGLFSRAKEYKAWESLSNNNKCKSCKAHTHTPTEHALST